MSASRLPAVLCLWFAPIVCAGCGTLGAGFDYRFAWPSESQPKEDVADPLHADQWTRTAGWTPLIEFERYPLAMKNAPQRRWSHPAAKLQVPFADLVKSNDMPGWNAAILWAQRDPRAAREVAPLLARLVTKPPRYRPAPPPQTPLSQTLHSKSAKPHANPANPAALPLQTISTSMRAAAAEAWCLILAESEGDAEAALAPAGRALRETTTFPPEVRGELFRGIARRVRSDRIPHLADALRIEADRERSATSSTEARRGAIEGCLVYAIHHHKPFPPPNAAAIDTSTRADLASDESLEEPERESDEIAWWPPEVWKLRYDSDPRVRKCFGELLAVTAHAEAFPVLKAQLADQENSVRDAALVSLGMLGTPAAMAELHKQAQRPEERIRQFAARGLAIHGEKELLAFQKDKSPVVRGELARRLGRYQTLESTRLLRELLSDASLDVQLAAVSSLAEWPDPQALPLLLHALAESSLKTRQTALAQLERRKGLPLKFPLDADPQDRATHVARLAREWQLPDTLVQGVRDLAQHGHPRLDALRVAEIRERLAALPPADEKGADSAAALWLRQLSSADLPLLEQALADAAPHQTEFLLRDVLPRLSPAYDALQKLTNADVAVRRRGAQALAQAGGTASLSPTLLGRLEATMTREQDQLVWRNVMQAVGQDGSDHAARLALLAVNSSWPDVRVLGCDYIARHGRGPHALWVLPLLHEPNKSVQLAAVIAAGRCRNPVVLDGTKSADGAAPLRGLRPLLKEAQGPLRFAAVVSMCQVGDPAALQELTRLGFDANPATRAAVAQAMGDSGQTRFIESLIRLAWTESSQNVKQAATAGLRRLVAPEDQPQRLEHAQTLEQTVELWVAWWDRHSPTP